MTKRLYARREASLTHPVLGVLVDDLDRRLVAGTSFRQDQLENAPIDRRLGVGVGCVVGQREVDIEKERTVLLDILVVVGGLLVAVGIDGDSTVLDREVERLGGDPRDVKDEQVG